MNGNNADLQEEIGVFQIVVLVLSIVILAALFVDTAFKLPAEISRILDWVDTAVCGLLLIDFGIRFHNAKSKAQFLKWGWIDLVASIPNLPVLRVGRLVRILRIIRLLRAIRASQRISNILLRKKLQGGMASIFIAFILLIMFSSIGILVCEQQDLNAKIKTAEDAVWWSVTTITTVGYGDLYPITIEGRCLAMVLMIAGVGMFGALSGIVASSIMGEKSKESPDRKEMIEWFQKLDEKIEALKNERTPNQSVSTRPPTIKSP